MSKPLASMNGCEYLADTHEHTRFFSYPVLPSKPIGIHAMSQVLGARG